MSQQVQEIQFTSLTFDQILAQLQLSAAFSVKVTDERLLVTYAHAARLNEGKEPGETIPQSNLPDKLNPVVTMMGHFSVDELVRFIEDAGPEQALFRVVQPCAELPPTLQVFNAISPSLLKENYHTDTTPVNVISSAPTLNQPGLLVMDMDSTAIQIECIDEIAKLAGVGEQVASVTAQAMRGELDFAQSLHARVGTLTGAPVSVINQVAQNLPLMPGLQNLVKVLKEHNWKIAIVSGGFTAMTEALKVQLDLDVTIANTLDTQVVDGAEQLTGTVSGKVIDAQAKADAVVDLARQYNIPLSQTVAMGDGANDLIMMDVAQLGVAFHAKPLVQAKADASVATGGLDQLLYFLV